jgi:hypothetical protein
LPDERVSHIAGHLVRQLAFRHQDDVETGSAKKLARLPKKQSPA